jgi:Domain of unknown function (DUF5710)
MPCRGNCRRMASASAARPQQTYFAVPFHEKDGAKELGARWDKARKLWYAPDAVVRDALAARWYEVPSQAQRQVPRQPLAPLAHPQHAHPAQQPQQHQRQWQPQAPGATPPARVYFKVDVGEKHVAKAYGGRWDADLRTWYADTLATIQALSAHFKQRNMVPVQLIGEDRSFAGNQLFIDLIPETAWYANVRAMVHPCDWDRVRWHVYARANHCCECCRVNTRDPTAGPGGKPTHRGA